MDSNGYNPSIMNTEQGRCYTCGRFIETVRHEVYYGIRNRNISKANGLWVNICPMCHNIIHTTDGRLDKKLKQECYARYISLHSRGEFYDLIGRYYE